MYEGIIMERQGPEKKKGKTDTGNSPIRKKAYSAPQLVEWGRLHELTLSGGNAGYSDGASPYSHVSGF